MLTLFRYNWQVRDDWLKRCKQVPEEELQRKRVGGVGSILDTLNHIVNTEVNWIRRLEGKELVIYDVNLYNTLNKAMELSQACRLEVEEFLEKWVPEMESKDLTVIRNGQPYKFLYGEVLRHVIAHEIHHIGQLSIWARELGYEPVSANLVGRGLFRSQGDG